MNRILLLCAGILLSANIILRADEGMWMLTLLDEFNIGKMSEMGLELTADDIYNVNQSSLKDAIGSLNFGSCTSSLISPDGLLLTNHHCAYDEIQYHSTVEHDYLSNGFWAENNDEELPNPGQTVSFIVRIEDISDEVLKNIDVNRHDLLPRLRIDEITKPIIDKAIEGTHFEAIVKSFFNGNRYYLIVMETFKDVRLVGAPPESIGKFGADTDNWMWPRHTGDFTLLRVYSGPDGKPAEYSPENIPLHSKYYLPVTLKGYNKNDFAMILGFPGTTNRYMTSFEVQELLEVEHPNRIEIRGKRQEILLSDMQADEKIRIQYASKYSRSSNYWKYSIGQSQGLKRLNILDRKREIENNFNQWINEDPERLEKYKNTLHLIEEGVINRKNYTYASQYIMETMYIGIESLAFAFRFRDLQLALSENPKDKEKINGLIDFIKTGMNDFYKDYNPPTDKKVSLEMLRLVQENISPELQPDIFKDINKSHDGNINKYVDWYFNKSIFPYRDKVDAFLKKPSLRVLEKDPAFQAALSMYNAYFTYYAMSMEYDSKVEQGRKLWMEGIQQMMPDKNFYPDANSTLRLTYGKVGDYWAKDAVYYSYKTTLSGVMEKEDPNNREFIVSEKLKELYDNKNYGQYGENDIMPVCFITDNDITGGNSGSPVINGKGELIGLAFDGNWEAMSGDIAYEVNLQKCINVDIRYVLFIIDKFAGATRLIDEMNIIH